MAAIEEIVHPVRGEGRERILDEARSLFLAKGFAATSMQEIADAVGLTKPALYYHFKDKQDLLLAVLTREMIEGRKAFVEVLSSHATLAKRLEIGASWCFSRIKGDMGRLMSDLHRVLPADRVHQFKCDNPMPVQMVAEMLEQSQVRGELAADENPAILARLFIGMIYGQLAMQNSSEIFTLEAEALGEIVARVFVDGIHTT